MRFCERVAHLIIVFASVLVPSSIVHAQISPPTSLRIAVTQPTTTGTELTSITQFGITWTFDRAYEAGQFVNGDWWVVGPVNVTGFSPASVQSGGRYMNGSMANPGGGTGQGGFDSYNSGKYDHSLNIAYGVSAAHPYVAQPGTSIVSSVSKTNGLDRDEFLSHVAVLTVLDSPPLKDQFRPPYAGSDKSLAYTFSDVDTELLQSKSTLKMAGTAPAWWEVELHLERPFMDFAGSWSRRQVHGDRYSYTYGRETSQHAGAVSLMLLSDATLSEKRTSLVRYIQRGIDLWGIYSDAVANGRGTPWGPNGGHHGGRKWTIMFAGALLSAQELLHIGSDTASRGDWFHEDFQTEYLTQSRIDTTQSSFDTRMKDDVRSNFPSKWNAFVASYPALASKAGSGNWRTDGRDFAFHPYTQAHLGMPEWHARGDQSREGNAIFGRYYQDVSAMTWHGQTLAALAMGLQSEWNNDAYFDYVHRHMSIARTGTDPFASALGYAEVPGTSTRSTSWTRDWPNRDTSGTNIGSWVDAMWDANWSDYYTFPH